MDTESSLHQTDLTTTSFTEERDSPPPALNDPTNTPDPTNPDIAFTASSLAQHDEEMEYASFDVDGEDDQKLFEEHMENVRLTLQSMKIEAPEHVLAGVCSGRSMFWPEYVLAEMARNYDGMDSLERLVAEYEDFVTQWRMREEYYAQNDVGDFHIYDSLGEELHEWEEN